MIFSDTGSISKDIKLNVKDKRSNVSVKYTNFCTRNYLAPIKVKLDVLHPCVMTSLCYGSETWGNNSCEELEVIYRMGLKTALSVRFSTCNEIIYAESGTFPVICMIKKHQIKFWSSLLRNMENGSSMSKLVEKAKDMATLHFIL